MRSSDMLSISEVAAVAGPPLAVVAATLWILVAGAFGFHAAWPIVEMTLPEAAALKDAAVVVQLIERGADPNRPASVRAGIFKGEALTLTPLQSAVATRRLEMVTLLVSNGAAPDAEERLVLACFARESDAPDIVAFFGGLESPSICEGVDLPW